MDKRDTSAPMDFAYENGGPYMDVDSPFTQFTKSQNENPRKRTHFDASIQEPNPSQPVFRFDHSQFNHNPTPLASTQPFSFSAPSQAPAVTFDNDSKMEDVPAPLSRRRSRRRCNSVKKRISQDSETSSEEEEQETNLSKWTVDPDLPDVLSRYMQLFCLVFLFCFVLYYIRIGIKMVALDIDQKSDEYSLEFIQEMATCRKEYEANRCAKDTRVPAMNAVCDAWEACMNKDPSVVGRARVSAETFAEILNAFIEPISWKTMAFILALLFGTVFLINFAFGHYRSQRLHTTQAQQPQHHLYPPWSQDPSAYKLLQSQRKSRSRSRNRYLQ